MFLGLSFIFYIYILRFCSIFALEFVFFHIFHPLSFDCQYQCNQLPGKNRLRSELLCIQLDIKPYTLTHPNIIAYHIALLSFRHSYRLPIPLLPMYTDAAN